jgi:hypothetical protein
MAVSYRLLLAFPLHAFLYLPIVRYRTRAAHLNVL